MSRRNHPEESEDLFGYSFINQLILREGGRDMQYKCSVCGYIYDEKKEGTPFSELPDDWTCPVCNAPKDAFERV